MSKIETLARNISVIRNASAKFDFSVIDPKEALAIKSRLEQIAGLCQIYIDFENGFDPDNESE